MGFWDDVDRLTTTHHKVLHRDDGVAQIVTTDSLLTQLRQAVEVGRESGGGSAAFGSRPTIDPAAADAYAEIRGQARSVLLAATGRVPAGLPETHIRLWAAAVNESTLVEVEFRRQHPEWRVSAWRMRGIRRDAVYTVRERFKAVDLVRHWCSRIETLLDPPDSREITAPCPMCQQRWVEVERDGEVVRVSALKIVRRDRRVEGARCAACGRSWDRSQFVWLANAIGALPPELRGDVAVSS